MRLITREVGAVTISIFFDGRLFKSDEHVNSIHAIIDAIGELFQREYTSTYEAVHSRIVQVADAIEDNADEAEAIRDEFQDIISAIDDIAQRDFLS